LFAWAAGIIAIITITWVAYAAFITVGTFFAVAAGTTVFTPAATTRIAFAATGAKYTVTAAGSGVTWYACTWVAASGLAAVSAVLTFYTRTSRSIVIITAAAYAAYIALFTFAAFLTGTIIVIAAQAVLITFAAIFTVSYLRTIINRTADTVLSTSFTCITVDGVPGTSVFHAAYTITTTSGYTTCSAVFTLYTGAAAIAVITTVCTITSAIITVTIGIARTHLTTAAWSSVTAGFVTTAAVSADFTVTAWGAARRFIAADAVKFTHLTIFTVDFVGTSIFPTVYAVHVTLFTFVTDCWIVTVIHNTADAVVMLIASITYVTVNWFITTTGMRTGCALARVFTTIIAKANTWIFIAHITALAAFAIQALTAASTIANTTITIATATAYASIVMSTRTLARELKTRITANAAFAISTVFAYVT